MAGRGRKSQVGLSDGETQQDSGCHTLLFGFAIAQPDLSYFRGMTTIESFIVRRNEAV